MIQDKSALLKTMMATAAEPLAYADELVALLKTEESQFKQCAVLPKEKFCTLYSERLNVQRDVLGNNDEQYLSAFETLIFNVEEQEPSADDVCILTVKLDAEGYMVFVSDIDSVFGVLPTLSGSS